MLPLKLVRSLLLRQPITAHSTSCSCIDDDDDDGGGGGSGEGTHKSRRRTPLLLFLPTREVITDTYTLAHMVRLTGMDLYPTPSLSHIIFALPSSSPSPPSPSTSSSSTSPPLSSFPSTWSSTASSSFPSLNGAVALPFPSLSSASIASLRSFVALSNGLFKLVFARSTTLLARSLGWLGLDGRSSSVDWDCCSASLFSRVGGVRIETMDGFCRALTGNGWTLFVTRKEDPGADPGGSSSGGSVVKQYKAVYLFRKLDLNRVRIFHRAASASGSTPSLARDGGGECCRVRELRLPFLDFKNAPLRILQYVLLMTDDIFFIA